MVCGGSKKWQPAANSGAVTVIFTTVTAHLDYTIPVGGTVVAVLHRGDICRPRVNNIIIPPVVVAR
jgi:hypothetical protein